jgi:autotransporter translocation and assembly factor TamB
MTAEVRARDLREADHLQQILRSLLRPGETIPLVNLEGSGDVTGVVTGRLPTLTFRGRFVGKDVEFKKTAFGQVGAQGSIDAAELHLLKLNAQNGGSEIDGEVRVDLKRPTSVWAFDGTIREWPVADFARVIPQLVHVTGSLSADGRVVADDGSFTGRGTIGMTAGSIFGVGFGEVHAEAVLGERQIDLNSIHASRGAAKIGGQLQLDTSTRRLAGSLEGTGLPLSVFSREGFDLQGEADAELRLTGTLDEPTFEMSVGAPRVFLEQSPIGRGRLQARVAHGMATGSLVLQDPTFELEARSELRLVSGNPFEGEIRWQGADLGPWMRFLRSGLPTSLRFFSDGKATFKGEWDSLASMEADASFDSIRAELGGYPLMSDRPVDIKIRDATLETSGMRLSGEGTEIELAGKMPLGEGNLDLHANGSVNLELIQTLYPTVTSSGDVRLSARVQGDWERPYLSGQADVSSGVLRFQGFPQAIGDIRGRVAFDNRTVRFPNLRATFGGAPVGISGTTLLSGLSPSSFELRVIGQGLRLRYPEGLIATLNGNLQMSGTLQSQILSGRIEVKDAQWVREYDLATGILVSQDEEGFEILEDAGEESALSNLRFDVEIVAPGTFKVRNSRAKIDAEAQLQLRGTFTHPILLGRSEALRGELFLLGQRYDLVSGKVEFIDPTSVKPFFDVVADTRVKSYRVELRLTGTPDRFFPELSSDPPLRTVDILRLLAGASERDILIGSEEEEIAGVGVASLLTERLTQEVGRRAERLFGLDRFSIDPFLVGQFANPTARVSIGKEIYRNLSVNYSTNLNAATETLILVEYTPEGPIRWIFSRDEDGALGVDLRFRKSF